MRGCGCYCVTVLDWGGAVVVVQYILEGALPLIEIYLSSVSSLKLNFNFNFNPNLDLN